MADKQAIQVLIIDDEPQVCDIMRQTLIREGYSVLTASDGVEGLDVLRDHAIDLVITDIIMPNKEGLEVIMAVKKHYPKVKIIAITGGGRMGKANVQQAALGFGADFAMAKPIPRTVLLEAVSDVMRADGGQGQVA